MPSRIQRSNQMDQEILAMLKQINDQLKQMQPEGIIPVQALQSATANGSDAQELRQTNQRSIQGNDQVDLTSSPSSNELLKLFGEVLKAKADSQDTGQQEQTRNPAQLTGKMQDRVQNQNNNVKIAQTASQILAEAQYELANELDASLKKLKQVISESEKIANKISNLIGEEKQANQQ